jgi:hypothetical protein
MLNHITEKTYELSTKAKKFWDYVKTNKENWKSHYKNERVLKKTFSVLLDVINSIKKTRNTYDEALRKINMLWDSTEEIFARDQFVQVLRSMRQCALRSMTMKNARRVVSFAMKNRLKNFARDVSINRKSVNRDWIKMTNENYDLRQIKSATCSNFQFSTLSSSFSSLVIMSSFLDAFLKEEKKNRKTIFVVLFFSNVLLLIKKKKNRKSNFVILFFSKMLFFVEEKKNRTTTFVDFFFDRILSSFSLTSSLIIFESLIRLSSSFSSIVLWWRGMQSHEMTRRRETVDRHRCRQRIQDTLFLSLCCVIDSD